MENNLAKRGWQVNFFSHIAGGGLAAHQAFARIPWQPVRAFLIGSSSGRPDEDP